MRVESPPLAGHAGARRCEAYRAAGPPRVHLTLTNPRGPVRSVSGAGRHVGTTPAAPAAVTAAALAACAIGLLGVDAGLLWIVVGVLTVRSVIGVAPGAAWAIACVGAGMRWGTFGLGDLETATRLLGPTVVSGAPALRIAMTVALLAAVVEEAAAGGVLKGSWPARGAALVAGVVLVPVFLVGGPSRLSGSGVAWAASTVLVLGAAVLLGPLARRFPPWSPIVVAAAAVLLAGAAG